MNFIWKLVISLIILDFIRFALAINTELEIIFLNALFSYIEPLIDALLINVIIFL